MAIPDAARDAGAPLVAIIVLNWNKLALTGECLRSLAALDYPNWRVYLVDNASDEPGIAQLAGCVAHLTLIRNARNLGYAGGNNQAMARAFAEGADYVWLLNNDAQSEPGTLTRLVGVAEADATIGMVSPLLYREAGSDELEEAGSLFDLAGLSLTTTLSLDVARRWSAERPGQVALIGAALLIRRALYQRIGGFDEVFFAYDEDIDLSIRSARAGFRNVLDFGARIHHRKRPLVGPTQTELAPHVYYYMTRNNIILWAKYGGPRGRLKVFAWELARRLGEIHARDLTRRNPPVAAAMLGGLWDGLLGRGGAYAPQRRMPAPLRLALLRWPGIWLRLLGGPSRS